MWLARAALAALAAGALKVQLVRGRRLRGAIVFNRSDFWGVEVLKHPNGQKYVLAFARDLDPDLPVHRG